MTRLAASLASTLLVLVLTALTANAQAPPVTRNTCLLPTRDKNSATY